MVLEFLENWYNWYKLFSIWLPTNGLRRRWAAGHREIFTKCRVHTDGERRSSLGSLELARTHCTVMMMLNRVAIDTSFTFPPLDGPTEKRPELMISYTHTHSRKLNMRQHPPIHTVVWDNRFLFEHMANNFLSISLPKFCEISWKE